MDTSVLQTDVNTNFLDNFKFLSELKLVNNNKLNLYCPAIRNNSFDYSDIIDELIEAIIPFTISRESIGQLDDGKYHQKKGKIARSKFRDYISKEGKTDNNKGELGELLLYCFLESHLNAPKILSKYELKTAANDYIKGTDGIHLLKLSDKQYQLIIGESKMNISLKTGLDEAFDSSIKYLNNYNKVVFEKTLISMNLAKQACQSEEQYQTIKSIIFPRCGDGNPFCIDDAFGIFIGFQFNRKKIKELSNNDARNYIYSEIPKIVKKQESHINTKLTHNKIKNHQFYFYLLPFISLSDERVHVLEEILK